MQRKLDGPTMAEAWRVHCYLDMEKSVGRLSVDEWTVFYTLHHLHRSGWRRSSHNTQKLDCSHRP